MNNEFYEYLLTYQFWYYELSFKKSWGWEGRGYGSGGVEGIILLLLFFKVF